MEIKNIVMVHDGDSVAFLEPPTPLSSKEFTELCKNICNIYPELKNLEGRGEEFVKKLSEILISEKNFTAINIIAGYPKNFFSKTMLRRVYFVPTISD